MIWREDDTIRFYRDTPDKRGVSELVISNTWGHSLYRNQWQPWLCSHRTIIRSIRAIRVQKAVMKHLIPFVKRFKTLCPRTDGFSTALSARYDGWGGLYDRSALPLSQSEATERISDSIQ